MGDWSFFFYTTRVESFLKAAKCWEKEITTTQEKEKKREEIVINESQIQNHTKYTKDNKRQDKRRGRCFLKKSLLFTIYDDFLS